MTHPADTPWTACKSVTRVLTVTTCRWTR